jgi:pimeloyl-ACP methyl ester carboxylesterase
MSDRFLVWVGAGMLAAGVSAATVAGAGVACADDGATAGKGTGTSHSTKHVERKKKTDPEKADAAPRTSDGPESKADESADTDTDRKDAVGNQDDDADAIGDSDDARAVTPRRKNNRPAANRDDKPRAALTADADDAEPAHVDIADVTASGIAQAPISATAAPTPEVKPVTATRPSTDIVDAIVETASAVVGTLLSPFATNNIAPNIPGAEPEMWTLAAASRREFETAFESPSPADTANPPRPTLFNVIPSLFFNAFQAFEQAVAGQPQVPPGSTVRVQRSTLNIDCGPGYTVDADWYFPDTGDEPPTRLIYFQHGFPGSGAEYDYTAAELAERNQAIVVAPTISSNVFDCYGCQLGGDPMHAAIGRLFLGDRADLLASAKAAGFAGDALPERFVIAGHSGGGQLAGGAAGYFEEFAPDDEDHNLVGVLLLDTSPIGGAIERGLDKIPEDIPVYTIAAAPSFLNSQGGVERLLEQKRPDQFVGVELLHGTHGDFFQSHNAIVQIGGWIAGMGIPRAENIEGAQQLMQGWIGDWYDGTHTGVYGDLGSTIDVPGGATAYVLPAPPRHWSIIDLIVDLGLQSAQFANVFQTCAVDPSVAAASRCTAD